MARLKGLAAHVLKRLPALTLDVALELAPGTVTALVGPSGAGKSTLLGCIAGHLVLDGGEVRFDGERWDGRLPPQARGVGLVSRPLALFPHLSARANVAFGATEPARVERLMLALELAPFAARYPRQLSAGERQRVAIARALAPRPRLLLLDEPFNGMDPELALRLREQVLALAREDACPVLLVTHDLAEACWLGDRLGVLASGRLFQLGTPEAVLARPVSAKAARIVGMENLYDGDAWGIRAEHVEIHAAPAEGAVPCTLVRLAPEGGRWRGVFRLATGEPLTAFMTAPSLPSGSHAWASLPATHRVTFANK